MPTKRIYIICITFLGVLVVALTVTTFVSYGLYKKAQDRSCATVAQASTNDVVRNVARLMVLPENETPTIATVSDLSKLQYLPFFKDAQQGDKVLMYATAKKAILYRPQDNRVIEVAPIYMGTQSQAQAVIPSR